jgi:transcriptional regulator with XRE-family HTH domain
MQPLSLDERIREEFALSELNMKDFAELIGASPSNLSTWLSFPNASIQLRTLNRIAHRLDCYPLALMPDAAHLWMKRYDDLSMFERVVSASLKTRVSRRMGVDTFDRLARERGYDPVYLIRVP